MAYTQDEWFKKTSKWVPSWWFEDKELAECYSIALFEAIAAVERQLQEDGEDCATETFILESTSPWLDMMGAERSIFRNPGESNGAYAIRVQDIFGSSDIVDLQADVDAVLNNGTAFFILNGQYGFFDDAMFCDDTSSRLIDKKKSYNWFSVIIPIQTGGVDATIQAAIINVLEQNVALGVEYDVLYLSSSDTDTDD